MFANTEGRPWRLPLEPSAALRAAPLTSVERRDKRLRGYFIAFGFSTDAAKEIKRASREDGLDIVPITVRELLEHERVAV